MTNKRTLSATPLKLNTPSQSWFDLGGKTLVRASVVVVDYNV